MRKNIYWITTASLFISFMLPPMIVDALELELVPRLETGITQYSLKYDAMSISTMSLPGQTSAFNDTSEKTEYSDDMTYVGGGATVFINRFYVDLSTQYAFDGTDRIETATSTYSEDADNLTSFLSYDYTRSAQFDHRDNAIALGYAVSRNFSVFAGYKWADLSLRTTTDGIMFQMFVDDNTLFKTIVQQDTVNSLKYQGPFIGATSGWDVDALRYLKGMLSVKLGLAFLNSKYTTDGKNTLHFTFSDETMSFKAHQESKGDTWGFTLGLGWTGNTPIENLIYTLQIGGYRYNFDNDNVYLGDISETVLNYKAGISYFF